jgi:hypothetical protein
MRALHAGVHHQHADDEQGEADPAEMGAAEADRYVGERQPRERRSAGRPAHRRPRVDDPPADQRGERAGRADQREQANLELREAVLGTGEEERHRGPEAAEAPEPAGRDDRPPAQRRLGQRGDHSGEGAGEQDADEQAAHQRADHPAPLVVGGQGRGVGHQHLDDDRGHAGQQRGRAERRQVRRDRAADQGDRADREQAG